MNAERRAAESPEHAIAIVGMACRMPGAADLHEFWDNLVNGREGVRRATRAELTAAGVPAEMFDNPRFVAASGRLDGIEHFDAGYFDITPSIAEVTSPQQRLLFEMSELALNDAGYCAELFAGKIGIFCAVESSDYAYHNLVGHPELLESLGAKTIQFANDPTFSATQVAYKLNLTGPAVNVSTACSSSLVAVHLACKALLDYDADMMLAGGASYSVKQRWGYVHQDGGIGSSDGHCRAFDVDADGTVSGNGAGMVVLKRLEDAIKDHDSIYAVILSSAINNDGNDKVSYSAAGVRGQAEVIADALALAGVSAADLGYVEAHGTGTRLGDPVEVAALTEAFRESTQAVGYCGLGSLKSNIGHLGCAAGVAGMIKTALSVHHKQIPPTLHVARPSPKLELDTSPFYLATRARPWPTDKSCAGVSSFGMGGTNVHAIVARWDERDRSAGEREPRPHVLAVSARTAAALENNVTALRGFLEQHPDVDLGSVAHTLRVGRRAHEHRIAVVAAERAQAIRRLEDARGSAAAHPRGIVMLLPGQGNQHASMGESLYRRHARYRSVFQECSAAVKKRHGIDLAALLLGDAPSAERARALRETRNAQIALFVVEYSLARMLFDSGIRPSALLGHSVGEYVAATLAGVFSLEDALDLLCFRGELMQTMPTGSMAAVQLPVDEVRPSLPDGLDVAAVNRKAQTVVSGPEHVVAQYLLALEKRGVAAQLLQVSHAFHSHMMRPCAAGLRERLRALSLAVPKIPFVSNLTGEWITADEATDPGYWIEHMCGTVQLRSGIECLTRAGNDQLFLEVGPGRSIQSALREDAAVGGCRIYPCMASAHGPGTDAEALGQTLASLWESGVDLDWRVLDDGVARQRVHLPGYAFDRQRFWIDPQGLAVAQVAERRVDAAPSCYAPTWLQSFAPAADSGGRREGWVLVGADAGILAAMKARLEREQQTVITVAHGQSFARIGPGAYVMDLHDAAHYEALVGSLESLEELAPRLFVYCAPAGSPDPLSRARADTRTCFHDLLSVQRAIARSKADGRVLVCLGESAASITGREDVRPSLHMADALCRSLNQQQRAARCVYLDVAAEGANDGEAGASWAEYLLQEWRHGFAQESVAYRDGVRYTRQYAKLDALDRTPSRIGIKRGGTYLITGGWGGIGYELARHLAEKWHAKLVLIGRSAPLLPTSLGAQWPAATRTGDTRDKLEELERLGARLVSIPVDVSDSERFARALRAASAIVGRIDGVFHAAGVPGGGLLAQQSAADLEVTFAPKVQGSINVVDVFRDKSPDFILLFSSQNALKGGLLRADYSAANAFMDGLALDVSRRDRLAVTSVNWCAWANVGMLHEHLSARGLHISEEKERESLSTREGLELVEALAKVPYPRVVVSKLDVAQIVDPPPAAPPEPSPAQRAETRPRGISTELVQPETEIALELRKIWQAALRIDAVGIHDNFFELGGNSLLAVQIVMRVRDKFGVELPFRDFLQTPTIEHSETLILLLKTEDDDLADLERLVAQVEPALG